MQIIDFIDEDGVQSAYLIDVYQNYYELTGNLQDDLLKFKHIGTF
jgi:hypothetical protein